MKRCAVSMFFNAAAAMWAVTAVQAQAWQQYASPEEAGFSSQALDRARQIGDSLQSGGLFVVYRGKVLVAWGDVSRKLQLHSVRKSLTSALYGIAVREKKIDLTQTLAQLGVNDTTPLTDAEKRATVRDIISARSGVYLPAAYAPSDQDSTRPNRGQYAPNTHWFYNNWDFNVAELIYEQRTGANIYEVFARQIATPIGMEDFTPADGFLAYEPTLSKHAAHTWRMSARDLARFGQLFLQKGKWNGKEVIPESWVKESTTPHSDLGDGRGYGYMWWTYGKNSMGPRYTLLNNHEAFAASGSGGQAIIVVPDADLVIVHRGDTDHGRFFPGGRVWAFVDAVLNAKTGEAKAKPRTIPLTPVPYASQLPPLPEQRTLAITEKDANDLVGEYDIGAPVRARITRFAGRVFAFFPGRGDAELLKLGENEFTIPNAIQPGVTVTVERNASGQVTAFSIKLGPQTIRGRRTG